MTTKDADAIKTGAIEAGDPRFLRRFDRWSLHARRFQRGAPSAARNATAIVRFAAGILSRLDSPAILHHTRSNFGGPLVRPLAARRIEERLAGLETPAISPSFPAIGPTASTDPRSGLTLAGPLKKPVHPMIVSRGDTPPVPRDRAPDERLTRSLLDAIRPASLDPSALPGPRESAPNFTRSPQFPVEAGNPRDSEAINSIHRAPLEPGPDAALAPPEARLLVQAEQSPSRSLGEPARSALAGFLGREIGDAEFYENEAANELNRRFRSDAFTVGSRVFFRQGRFEPGEPQGLGLIGHELTHVHAGRPGFPRAQGPAPAASAEERTAVTNELRILRELGVPARPSARAESMNSSPAPSGANPVAGAVDAVKTAATGRLESVDPQDEDRGLTERQFARLREQLYRELVERIRIECERGA